MDKNGYNNQFVRHPILCVVLDGANVFLFLRAIVLVAETGQRFVVDLVTAPRGSLSDEIDSCGFI